MIIEDLDIKGSGFVASRGATLHNTDFAQNPAHIDGKINGTRIVILTQYVKKAERRPSNESQGCVKMPPPTLFTPEVRIG